MSELDGAKAQEQAQLAQIRKSYEEARALGISEEEFYRQMSPIVGDELLDEALEAETS